MTRRRPLLAPSRLAGFDWPTGASRPRYMRYKSLTSTRQEGTCRFGPKDWVGLPDGEYLFSIDTGSIMSGADSSHRPLMASDRLPHQVRPTRASTASRSGCGLSARRWWAPLAGRTARRSRRRRAPCARASRSRRRSSPSVPTRATRATRVRRASSRPVQHASAHHGASCPLPHR